MKKGLLIAGIMSAGLVASVWAQGPVGMNGNSEVNGNSCGKGMMGNAKHVGMGYMHNSNGRGAPVMKKMMQDLNLSDEQRNKIREVMRESRGQMNNGGKGYRHGNLGGQGKMNRQGIGMHKRERGMIKMDASKFMSANSFDKEAYKKSVQERWKKMDELRAKRREAKLNMMADRMEKIFNILTPAQREKLIELSNSNK